VATRKRKVATVDTDSYNQLEVYCIWLNEYHRALRNAGFSNDNALWLLATKDSYPDWVSFKIPTNTDIAHYMDEDED
jgi:hypothetical protein